MFFVGYLATFPRSSAGKEGGGTISNAEVSSPLSALFPYLLGYRNYLSKELTGDSTHDPKALG